MGRGLYGGAGPVRRGGARTEGRGGAPRSPWAVGGSKKTRLAAVARSDRCVSLERGAVAALSRPRDLELAATECGGPGLPWPARAGSLEAGKKSTFGRWLSRY